MTHELNEIFQAYQELKHAGISVLATVVHLEGSGYRRPGVRMLCLPDGTAVGAVSGGCVERDITGQAQEVMRTGKARIMTYDGRYRLGCEGMLYILLEPFDPSNEALAYFKAQTSNRTSISLESDYQIPEGEAPELGSYFIQNGKRLPLGPAKKQQAKLCFEQTLQPTYRLLIFGGEHDSVKLTSMAAALGWEVHIVVAADEAKRKDDFPGASDFSSVIPEQIGDIGIDSQTAVLLMTHSFSKDLKYLLQLTANAPAYLGILGPAHRRERILSELIERQPDVDDSFLDRIHGPAGLDLGAETPQEIALAILSEILKEFRQASAQPLNLKDSRIHSREES